MPKLNWTCVDYPCRMTKWTVDAALISTHVSQLSTGEYRWEVSHMSGLAPSLEEAQGQAEAVMAREALKLLTTLGILSKDERV